MIGHIGTETRP